MIEVKGLSYCFEKGTPFEKIALENVDLTIADSSFVGIAGSTGSGKSTLVRLMSGLLKPSCGSVLVNGNDINSASFDRLSLRKEVGIVFQFPEHQLFEETVLKDVMFGPRNIGQSEKEAKESAKRALSLVGLDKSYYKRSPFSLSGGEKRRVAIAGVLAMEPKVLILDEPAAGLDPGMHNEIFSLLQSLNREGRTIIIVSHSMDDIARYCSDMVLLGNGRVIDSGKPSEVFKRTSSKPFASRVAERLGLEACTIEDLVEGILQK